MPLTKKHCKKCLHRPQWELCRLFCCTVVVTLRDRFYSSIDIFANPTKIPVDLKDA